MKSVRWKRIELTYLACIQLSIVRNGGLFGWLRSAFGSVGCPSGGPTLFASFGSAFAKRCAPGLVRWLLASLTTRGCFSLLKGEFDRVSLLPCGSTCQ